LPCTITCYSPRDQCHAQAIGTRGHSSRETPAQARRNKACGQGLNENRSHNEAWLGVQGGKRRELVRNAGCVREKVRDINLGKTPISSEETQFKTCQYF